jgi:hypothetical protein
MFLIYYYIDYSEYLSQRPTPLLKGLASAALLIPWMTWKHRNAYVFEGAQPSIQVLTHNIKEEIRLWARAGARV